MIREYLQRTFFEDFNRAILGKIPYFHKVELPADLNDYIKILEREPHKNNVRELESHKEWLRMILRIYGWIRDNDSENIKILRDAEKNGKELSNDFLYKAGLKVDGTIEKVVDNAKVVYGLLWAQLMEFNWDFHDSGAKIFRLEEQIFNELYYTEITKIDDKYLNLPFQTIALHLPYNLDLCVKDYPVKWLYLSEFENEDGKELHICTITSKDYITVFEFSFTGGDIFTQLKEQVNNQYSSKIAVKETRRLTEFIISFLLYLNTENTDIRIINPAKNKLSKDCSAYPVCSLGGNISVNKDFKAIRLFDEESEIKNERHVLKWMVRGHFRQQPIGEGRKERKTIWIRPFIKGRERESDILSKPSVYKL